MGLLAEHKNERRDRIIAAARRLVAERGYDGLTMRDLADAARVSVPTLYNLFGGKDAILVAEMQRMAGTIAAALPSTGDSFYRRARIAFETGMRFIEEAPEFFRAVNQVLVTSAATVDMRSKIEQAFVAIMRANLIAAKRAGQLVAWAEPTIVAHHLFGVHTATSLAWSLGQIDFAMFRVASESGMCHVLTGVATGPFHAEVTARIRELMKTAPASRLIQEESDATSRD